MLCFFSFKNFKSYRTETEFDFQAAAIPEFEESLLKADKSDVALLPVSAIYGPNGGGKTNLLQALACLISMVVRPVAELEKNRQRLILQYGVSCVPFLFDNDSKTEPTEFQIYFRQSEREYRYYIAVLDGSIISESLYWRNIGGKRTGTVFEREREKIKLGTSISKSGINKMVNPRMPYLSFLAINYNLDVITEVMTWFESCIVQSYAIPEVDNRVLLVDEEKTKRRIITVLNDLDIDICDYRYNAEERQLYTGRMVDGEYYELPLLSNLMEQRNFLQHFRFFCWRYRKDGLW